MTGPKHCAYCGKRIEAQDQPDAPLCIHKGLRRHYHERCFSQMTAGVPDPPGHVEIGAMTPEEYAKFFLEFDNVLAGLGFVFPEDRSGSEILFLAWRLESRISSLGQMVSALEMSLRTR